jgi:HD-like signal output (HDOD) protein
MRLDFQTPSLILSYNFVSTQQGCINMTNTSAPKFELKKILSRAQLPGLPQSLLRIIELSRDPDIGFAEIAAPVEVDPGLTGQVLRFVNSSYFGFARKISSVKMAVALLGIRTIQSFALWSAMYSTMTNPKYGLFHLIGLWQDSLRRALFARHLARALGLKDAEEVFAAALLQDIAIPILAKESPQIYKGLLEARKQGNVRLSVLENQFFGWTHAQAGGMMARYWHLPDEFAYLIEEHINIDVIMSKQKRQPDVTAVAMSALLPTVADPVWNEFAQFEIYYKQLIPGNRPTITELLAKTDAEFEQFVPIMKIASPEKSLVERYNESTAPIMQTVE